MAVNIKLKRSAVPGKVPSTSSLELGEIALNTYEGKAYMLKQQGSTQTVIELASTSGSILSASYANFATTAATASYSTTLGASLSSPANNQVRLLASDGSTLSTVTVNNVTSASYALSSSFATTASFAQNAPNAVSASYAATASSADNFLIRGNATASNLLVTDTITAQRLVVQVITSSQELVTGSTKFGTSLSNTHQFTGSVSITGSLGINGVDYTTTSASFDTRITTNSASIALLSSSFTSFSSSYNTGSFKGQFSGSFSGSLNNLQGTATHIPYFSSSQILADSAMLQSTNNFSIAINQDNVTVGAPEALYVWQPSTSSYNVISGKGNLNNYLQLNIQNTNQGVSASSDVVATANNGSETTNYIDMGINSENYAQNFVGGPNDAYLYSAGNDLHIGNITPNKPIQFFAGGSDSNTNRKLQLSPNNQHQMTGSLDISGSLTVKDNITGNLIGTASWASNALQSISSSYANNATSASYAVSASNSISGAYAFNATSASYALTASYASNVPLTASYAVSSSFATSASYAFSATSASYAASASSAISSSYAFSATSASYALSASNAISSSYAFNATSASYAITASSAISSSYAAAATSASYAVSASSAISSSYAFNATSASYAVSASNSISGAYAFNATSASFATTASYALNVPATASFAISASYAATASYINPLRQDVQITGSLGISGSTGTIFSANIDTISFTGSFAQSGSLTVNGNITTTGTITAQQLNVQVITSSVEFVTGSTHFGTITANTHEFTGSVTVSGSLAVNGSSVITSNQTSSMSVLSSSYALTSSFAENSRSASYALSASSAISSSYSFNATSASYAISASNAFSSSYALTASFVANAQTASFVQNAVSASYVLNAISSSFASTASFVTLAQTASFVQNAQSASYVLNAVSSSFASTASFVQNAVSASYVLNAISSSFASTASFVQNAVSASFAELARSASYAITASFALNAGSGGGGGLSALYIQDEGITQGTASYIDFVGAGVTATVVNGTASINVPGGGGGGGGIVGQNAILTQSVANTTWSFTHNLGTQYPVFTIFDASNDVIIPNRINAESTSSAKIYFSTARTGYAVASLGGGIVSSSFAESASYAATATSASVAISASRAANATSASYALTASFVTLAQTASFVQNAQSASVATSASFASTASFVANAQTASYVLNAVSASFASTASSANNFLVRNTLTAQTIVVQTITSSVDFVTGSTHFGTIIDNTHEFTGSVSVSGSLAVNGSNVVLTNQTSSMSVLSASFASTASYLNPLSQSVILTGPMFISGSLTVSGSSTFTNIGLGIFSGSVISTNGFTGSLSGNATSASYSTTASILKNSSATVSSSTGIYTSGSTLLYDLSAFKGAMIDYVVSTSGSGASMRAGTFTCAWNNTTSTSNESMTMDIGDTSMVQFSADSTGSVFVAISSGSWVIDSLYRALGTAVVSGSTPPPPPTGSGTYTVGAYARQFTLYSPDDPLTTGSILYTDAGFTTPYNESYFMTNNYNYNLDYPSGSIRSVNLNGDGNTMAIFVKQTADLAGFPNYTAFTYPVAYNSLSEAYSNNVPVYSNLNAFNSYLPYFTGWTTISDGIYIFDYDDTTGLLSNPTTSSVVNGYSSMRYRMGSSACEAGNNARQFKSVTLYFSGSSYDNGTTFYSDSGLLYPLGANTTASDGFYTFIIDGSGVVSEKTPYTTDFYINNTVLYYGDSCLFDSGSIPVYYNGTYGAVYTKYNYPTYYTDLCFTTPYTESGVFVNNGYEIYSVTTGSLTYVGACPAVTGSAGLSNISAADACASSSIAPISMYGQGLSPFSLPNAVLYNNPLFYTSTGNPVTASYISDSINSYQIVQNWSGSGNSVAVLPGTPC